jgi:hypothetical protein
MSGWGVAVAGKDAHNVSGVLPGDHRDAGVAYALRRAWLRGERGLTGAPGQEP